ncbi:hypothetical protein O181_013098 [Austropuccinia psidii MF-1]|uniref:Uncharacterized protein n=1 Tax=Austropuccinia psidii MF-1 TaxID=1389203 RepID=A0A9Q3BYK4_9BASI|nr:hypothetical protein [Austropuccinia psidii MF-1]
MLLSSIIPSLLLAASVISSPTQSGSSHTELVASGKTEFEVAQKAVIQVQQPVKTLCYQGQPDEVKGKLESLYNPVYEVSTKVHEIVQIKEKIVYSNVEAYFVAFVKLLVEFEVIIKTVGNYPKIVNYTKTHFTHFDTHFAKISKDLQDCGIDVSKRFREHVELNFTIWATVGFTFQTKYLEGH